MKLINFLLARKWNIKLIPLEAIVSIKLYTTKKFQRIIF